MNASEIVSYLYGGRDAKDGEVPWQVAVQVNDMDTFLCGGSIIGDKWAYCIQSLFQFGLKVRYNTLKLSGGSQMDVKKATPHTKFNAAKLQADISVLELTGSLPTDKINCKIIALPQSDLKPTEGLELTFSGWDTNPEGDPPFLDNLQVTNFTSVTNDRCKKKITDLDDGNACALAKKDICTTSGDRGGPAANITDTPITLYGIIITHEKTCHEPVSPTNDFFEVMTFVSYYKWWIDAIMQGLVPTTEAPTK